MALPHVSLLRQPPHRKLPLDAEYRRRAITWAENCGHLYIWHYIVDFAHYYAPFPNFRAMEQDLRFYKRLGVEGIYLQAMGQSHGGGECCDLRAYYGAKLLWNPDQDGSELLQDFLQGYYGAAWRPVWQYITMLHDKVENENIHMHLYTNPAQGYLPDGIIHRAQQLFDEAEAAVENDPELLERVRVARMPITYARIFPRNGYTLENGFLRFDGDIASLEETAGFIERMKAHGFSLIREWGGEPEQLMAWSAAGNIPVPYERISSAHLIVDVLPALGGRILRVIHRDSAECVTAFNVQRHLFFPFAGGEELRMGTLHEAPTSGALAPYETKEKTNNRLVLHTSFRGFQVQREIFLSEDAPVLTVRNTVTNPGEKTAYLLVRSHIELDMGRLMDTQISFTNAAGQSVGRGTDSIVLGLREGERYFDVDMPAGSWTFEGSKGLQLTQRFDPAQVDHCWAYAYPASLNELETEVWMKPVTLKSGESVVFAHELEVSAAPNSSF